jgi:hypothetical protein
LNQMGLLSKSKHLGIALVFSLLTCSVSFGQETVAAAAPAQFLPAQFLPMQPLIDAPEPQPRAESEPKPREMDVPPMPPARRYAQVIEPGQAAYRFTRTDKLIFSFTGVVRPITVLPGLYSAGYEQLFNSNPKYGHDAGAFGEKLGAAMLRSASVRVFSDGILAGALHQDPRYYRIAHGTILHRGLLAARAAVIRRGDDGANHLNTSGIGGRALAAALTVTYYPEPSITAVDVTSTFLVSIATDAGGNLVLEFLPSLLHKVPVFKKLGIE